MLTDGAIEGLIFVMMGMRGGNGVRKGLEMFGSGVFC